MSPPPVVAQLIVRTVIDDAFIEKLQAGKIDPADGDTCTGVTADNLKEYLLELCLAFIKDELSLDKYMIGLDLVSKHENLPELLADVFWFLWVAHEPSKEQQQESISKIIELVKECLKQQKVQKRHLMETSELEFLQEAGIIPSAEVWRKKEVRFNTRHSYQQHKYNLLREENEGYAKALTCLLQVPAAADKDAVQSLKVELVDLIGCFDLDPNRLLSLVLEAYECNPLNTVYPAIIPLIFNPDAVAELLGFKFLSHQKPNAPPAPDSLYVLAARMIQHNFVKTEELLAYLNPIEDKAVAQTMQKASADLKEKAENIGQRSLNDKQAEGAQGPRRVSAQSLDLDATAWAAEMLPESVTAGNQRLGLVLGLLKVEAWPHTKSLMDQLLSKCEIAAAAYPPIAEQLCSSISARLQTIYKAMYPQGVYGGCILDSQKPVDPGPKIGMMVFEMLRYLGVYLFQDPHLITKVARVLRHQMVFHSKPQEEGDKSTQLVVETIARVLMPAVGMNAGNPGLVQELWELLKLLPPTLRHRVYFDVKASTREHPLLLAASKLSKEEVRKVLRRVSVSKDKQDRNENSKPLARIMAKAAMCQPSAMADAMFSYITYGEQMLEATVESLRYLHPLCFDVLTFELLTWLAADSEDKKVKEDGVSLSIKQQSLAAFTGWLCRKSQEMDITSLTQYLLYRLRENKSMDLIILKELISRMTGITIVNQVSEGQFDILACSELLQEQLITMSGMFGSKSLAKGCTRLLKALQPSDPNHQLLLPLMVLLAQQPILLPWRYMRGRPIPLKMASEMVDRSTETFLAYVEMMQRALGFEEYKELLPSLPTMHHTYGIPVEMCMLLYRPILKSLEGQNPLNTEDGEIGEAMEEGEEKPEPMENGDAEPPAPASKSPPADTDWAALVKEVRELAPPTTWQAITPDFYITFWGLTYYDLHCPAKAYEDEVRRLKQEIILLDDQMRPNMRRHRDELPKTEEELAELARTRSRNIDVVERLGQDLEEHQKRVEEVNARLVRDKGNWLVKNVTPRVWSHAIIQECLYPRMLLSPADALFCYHFIMKAHQLEVPGLPTTFLLDKVIRVEVARVVPFCCTDHEISNLGVFLLELLKTTEHWRSSEEIYEKECGSKSGFIDKNGPLKFDIYRRLAIKWQIALANYMRTALSSSDYHLVHNALLLLNKLVQVFPVVTAHANQLKDAATKIQNNDPRGDLKLMAQSYVAALSAESKKPGRMLTMEEYMGPVNYATHKKSQNRGSAAASVDSSKGGTDAAARKPTAQLRPEAPTFVPKPAGSQPVSSSEPKSPQNSAVIKQQAAADKGADAAEDRNTKRQRTDGGAKNESAAAEAARTKPEAASAPKPSAQTSAKPDPAVGAAARPPKPSEPSAAATTPSKGVKRDVPPDGPAGRGLKRESESAAVSDTKRRRAAEEDVDKPSAKGSWDVRDKDGSEQDRDKDRDKDREAKEREREGHREGKDELEAGETREEMPPPPKPAPKSSSAAREREREKDKERERDVNTREQRDRDAQAGRENRERETAGARKRGRSSEREPEGHKEKDKERARDLEADREIRDVSPLPQASDARDAGDEEEEASKSKSSKGKKHKQKGREAALKESESQPRSRSKQREEREADRGSKRVDLDKDGETTRGQSTKGKDHKDGRREGEQDRGKQAVDDNVSQGERSKQEKGRERGESRPRGESRYLEEGEHVPRHAGRERERAADRDTAPTRSPHRSPPHHRDVANDVPADEGRHGERGSSRNAQPEARPVRDKNLMKAALTAVKKQDDSKATRADTRGEGRGEGRESRSADARGGEGRHGRHGSGRADAVEQGGDFEAERDGAGRRGQRARAGKHENIQFDLPEKKRR